ncbi:hypothetical protein B0H13DRAFT_2306098 [Mycena leptocephala]|nr:hypothetical protein B0H13DRAFT_2306098 [Mycena leptocephala]
MDRRAPYTARPAAGASWFSLARLVVLLQGLVPLFRFLEWFLLDRMDWDLAGFRFELEFGIWIWVDNVLVEWIRRRSWKESQWRWIWNVYDSLGDALVAPPYHQLSFSRTLIALIVWIATCIYFVWSPEPARIGLIVFGVCGWISAFTCTLDSRVSSGAHREGLIQTFDKGNLACGTHSQKLYPLLGFTQLAGEVDNKLKQNLFIATKNDNARVDSLQRTRTAPFHIPRPWDADAPKFSTDSVDDLFDFLENVDTIIELGHVENEQERKALLTSYLPVTKRLLWRGMKMYEAAYSFTEFRTEICCLHPEVADRERGSLEDVDELCKSSSRIGRNEAGRLRRFSMQFCALVEKLQRPPALLTNRDACAKYLRTLDNVFQQRVRKAVGERQIMRVLLRQLGVKAKDVDVQRREDPISLQDMVEIAETIAATDTAYLMDFTYADVPNDSAQRELQTRSRKVVNATMQLEGQKNELYEPHCIGQSSQDATTEVFPLESGLRDGMPVKNAPAMWPSLRDDQMACRTVRVSNGEDVREEISTLVGRMQELKSAVTQDANGLVTWCRDGVGGLWEETSRFQDELGDVRDELRSIQTQLKDLDTYRMELAEAANLGITEVRADMAMLRQGLRDREESCSRARDEMIFCRRENVEYPREVMLDGPSLVQHELSTIQRRLREAQTCATASQQHSPAPEEVNGFLLNWMKEDMQVGRHAKNDEKRKERSFMPLLTKKQQAAMERQRQRGPSNCRAKRTECGCCEGIRTARL